MNDPSDSSMRKQGNSQPNLKEEEDRLSHGLVSRGLVTRDEVKTVPTDGKLGAEKYLQKLHRSEEHTSELQSH